MALNSKKLIAIGIVALLVGLSIYVTDRPGDRIYMIYRLGMDLDQDGMPNLFGPLSNNLPSFIHVFSFSLITAGLLSSRRRDCFLVCFGWFFINLVFEMGQKFKGLAVSWIPDWFEGVLILENLRTYFSDGTFDFGDLLAAAVGAAAACLFIFFAMERSDRLCKREKQSS